MVSNNETDGQRLFITSREQLRRCDVGGSRRAASSHRPSTYVLVSLDQPVYYHHLVVLVVLFNILMGKYVKGATYSSLAELCKPLHPSAGRLTVLASQPSLAVYVSMSLSL